MGQELEPLTSAHFYELSDIINQADNLIAALDKVFVYLRKVFIFDNLAIYNYDEDQRLTPFYAKALGRGKDAGAEISWGEKIANQIIEENERFYIDNFPSDQTNNRLEQPFFLGLPLRQFNQCLGVMIFIRFGSPPFTPADCELGVFIAQHVAVLFNRQHLEQEYGALQRQRHKLQTSEDLISRISHEIRTPLGGIKGYTTTLLRSDTSWDKASEQEFLRIIDDETDYLIHFIENLLDSARLSSGMTQINFYPLQVEDVVREAINRIKQGPTRVTINLGVPPSLQAIQGDPTRLNQVFLQLFNNALKYAPGSDIWVKIKQDKSSTIISVRDFGPGIAEQYLPFIFDRFYRNPEISTTIHGSGLGLFICQQIILSHQGLITVESKLGKGTTFMITLPNCQYLSQ